MWNHNINYVYQADDVLNGVNCHGFKKEADRSVD